MDKKLIIKDLVGGEKEIARLITKLSSEQANIATIDIDLTLEKLRKLYDLVLKLKNYETDTYETKVDIVSESLPAEEESKKEDTSYPLKKEEELPNENKHVSQEIVAGEMNDEETREEKKQQEPDTPALFEEEEISATKPEKPQEKQVSTGVTMDLFGNTVENTMTSEDSKTIADTISEQIKEESVADKLNKTAISDLKEAIGINEKFFFINELFDGNMGDYNKAVDTLNNFSGKDEAMAHLNELKTKYQWDENNEALKQLSELINRRY